MKLEAKIALILGNRIPQGILERVLGDTGLLDQLGLAPLNYAGFGGFVYGEIVSAVNALERGADSVELTSLDGEPVSMSRKEGRFVLSAPAPSDKTRVVPEFGLISSQPDVRTATVELYASTCWPFLPARDRWRQRAEQGQFSERDLVEFIQDVTHTAGNVLNTIRLKTAPGSAVSIETLFPDDLTYYESLVGPPSEKALVALGDLFNAKAPSLDPGARMRWWSALSIIRAFTSSGVHYSPAHPVETALLVPHSPFSLLDGIRLRARQNDGQSLDWVRNATAQLVATDEKARVAWQLLAALIDTSLRRVASSVKLSRYPLRWRRLASFAHAAALFDTLRLEVPAAKEVTRWLNEAERIEDVVGSFTDIRIDPYWTRWECTAEALRATVMLATQLLREQFRDWFANIATADDVWITPEERALCVTMPGPLNDGKTISLESVPGTAAWLDASVDAIATGGPTESWAGLTIVATRFSFPSQLMQRLADAIDPLTHSDSPGAADLLIETLSYAAKISACQRHVGLADAVGRAVLREARGFSANNVEAAFRLLMVAAAAQAESNSWEEWLDAKLTELAFLVPRGEVARRFAQLLVD
jgi:hypothetical protein